jgi:hypothetical protein
VVALVTARGAAATPPVPAGEHPRLFLTGGALDLARANATRSGTAAQAVIRRCQNSIDEEKTTYATRGGSDGDYWPGSAVACTFAYLVTTDATKRARYLDYAVKWWTAALNDANDLGDGLGCTPSELAKWDPATLQPRTVVAPATPDDGYAMRWYGPYIALTYDWLHGVDDPRVQSLLAQTRGCLAAWVDNYTIAGKWAEPAKWGAYFATKPGVNYNAGFVVGKALAAVAIGNDSSDGARIWQETVDDLLPNLLVGKGLLGLDGGVGSPVGPMVGGDWIEGWQYGPLSVLEYAAAARAVADAGAPQPELARWTDSLGVRYIHATTPDLKGQWIGGDYPEDNTSVFAAPSRNTLDAVLIGLSGDTAASWAAKAKELQAMAGGGYIWNALAEVRWSALQARGVAATDYRAQPAAPLWYLARGTRALYARTSWDPTAYWAVFSSAPALTGDHQHYSAGNFVLSRGADPLIVDPSSYEILHTKFTNAVCVDSPLLDRMDSKYWDSQTLWGRPELVWARGTSDAVFAARSDFAKAFANDSGKSDVKYAVRDWTFLPEGEIAVIDRVRTAGATNSAHLSFYTKAASLAWSAAEGQAKGTSGGSAVAIHKVIPAAGSPTITATQVSYGLRFPTQHYTLDVPGEWAVAVHVIDALGSSEAAATVGSLNDPTYYDPQNQNAGIVGAAVYRNSTRTYVLAPSTDQAQTTLTYGVPGDSAARHVVFGAPEDSSGRSMVSVTPQGDRCVVTITAGAGYAGRPLLFSVDTAAKGCAATESTSVAPGTAPPSSGGGGTGSSSGSSSSGGGTGGSSGSSSSGGGTGSSSGSSSSSGGTSSGGTTSSAGSHGGCSTGGSALTPAWLLVVLLFWRLRRSFMRQGARSPRRSLQRP